MEWQEVNCIVAALEALIEKYKIALLDKSLPEDERSDLGNDLAYAEIMQGKYQELLAEIEAG